MLTDDHNKAAATPGAQELDALRSMTAQGRYTDAIVLAQSITLRFPNFSFGWRAVGWLLKEMGREAEALPALKRVVALCPTDADTHFQIGVAQYRHGQLVEAETAYRRTVQLRPDYYNAYYSLGILLQDQRRLIESEATYRRALQIRPEFVEALNNLGLVLQAQGRLSESEASYRRALQTNPRFSEAHHNMAVALQAQGRLTESEAAYRCAIQISPKFIEALNNLGKLLRTQMRLVESEECFRRALEVSPDGAELHNSLGDVLLAQNRPTEAETSWRKFLQLKPDQPDGHYNLGISLHAQGRLSESEASYRRALQIKPDYFTAHCNLLMSINYQAGKSNEEIFRAHREFDARHGAPLQDNWPGYRGRRRDFAPDRRLKIGYVSPDFRRHSVAHFITPLLREHDRRYVEVFCYAEIARPDVVTSRLESLTDRWVNSVGLSDSELAERIATDGIDVLVDLAGHTAGNRLLVFARAPAPIQITWLGYPNTTGLSAMSHRLVDAVTDPPDEADHWASEDLVRLDQGFLCFEAPADAPEPRPPSRLETSSVTFGSFNNLVKLSDQTLDAWIALLARIADSRLLLKGVGLDNDTTRRGLIARFAQRGGCSQQLQVLGHMDNAVDHLAAYKQVDVALDPFPYNGTTTTCEAMWMGVPVVTLAGNRHASRVGASLLTQVGLTDLIAQSVEEYIDVAAALAGNSRRLSSLRQTLRTRMRASSLCDSRGFARKIETTYRNLWQRYCARQSQDYRPA